MSIFSFFRKKISRAEFIEPWITIHKDISRSLFFKFKNILHYKDELDMLIAFTEVEYLMFWIIRQKLKENIMSDIYKKYLEGSKLSYDDFKDQIELRHKIYDTTYISFLNSPSSNDISQRGIVIGDTLIKIIGKLEIANNGKLSDEKSSDITNIFLASQIWFTGVKIIGESLNSIKSKCQIEEFLRDA